MRELQETAVAVEHVEDSAAKDLTHDITDDESGRAIESDVPDNGLVAKRRKREVGHKSASTKSSTKCKFFLEGRCKEGDQ